ncbi:TRAP transporter substrate-binding protein DctP [Roseibium sp. M-1]
MNPVTTLGAAALVVALTTAASAESRLLVNCFLPPQHVICAEVLPTWKAAVEEATERRVRILIPAKSLAPPPEQLVSVRNGVFDGAVQFNGFIANEVKGTLVAMMPFTGTSNAEASSVALWRTHEQFFAADKEYAGVELLGLFTAPASDFYSMTDTPIQSLADATGRKMWALPGVTASLLKDNGGSVVSGPAVQMTEIIQRGVVDGYVGIPAIGAKSFNVLPYAKSVTRTSRSIFTPAFSFFVNQDKWTEIDPTDKALILELSGENFARMAGELYTKQEMVALAEQDEGALSVVQAEPGFEAELAEAAQPYIDGWIAEATEAGFDAAAALTFYKAQVDELSGN